MIFSQLNPNQSNSNQIYGFITDRLSGEAFIGANVFVEETGKGMATDINGYYVLSEIPSSEGVTGWDLLRMQSRPVFIFFVELFEQ